MSARFNNTVVYRPDQLNLSGVTLASERTSNTIECDGRDQMTINVNLSARTAATAVLVAVDISPDGTTWYPLQSESISSGTATLSDLVWSKTVSGTDTWSFYYPIAAQKMRIRISGTGGAAGDVVSVTLRLSNVGN